MIAFWKWALNILEHLSVGIVGTVPAGQLILEICCQARYLDMPLLQNVPSSSWWLFQTSTQIFKQNGGVEILEFSNSGPAILLHEMSLHSLHDSCLDLFLKLWSSSRAWLAFSAENSTWLTPRGDISLCGTSACPWNGVKHCKTMWGRANFRNNCAYRRRNNCVCVCQTMMIIKATKITWGKALGWVRVQFATRFGLKFTTHNTLKHTKSKGNEGSTPHFSASCCP